MFSASAVCIGWGGVGGWISGWVGGVGGGGLVKVTGRVSKHRLPGAWQECADKPGAGQAVLRSSLLYVDAATRSCHDKLLPRVGRQLKNGSTLRREAGSRPWGTD